jgi:hypothetical protein
MLWMTRRAISSRPCGVRGRERPGLGAAGEVRQHIGVLVLDPGQEARRLARRQAAGPLRPSTRTEIGRARVTYRTCPCDVSSGVMAHRDARWRSKEEEVQYRWSACPQYPPLPGSARCRASCAGTPWRPGPRTPPLWALYLFLFSLNSVSGLVSNMWYRIPYDQSELSISKIPPTDSPTVRPRRDP